MRHIFDPTNWPSLFMLTVIIIGSCFGCAPMEIYRPAY
jgi:hypothetical protein